MSRRWIVCTVCGLAVAATAALAQRLEQVNGAERSTVELGGALVAVAAPEPGGPLFVLVRPAAPADEAPLQVSVSTSDVEVVAAGSVDTGPDAPRWLLRLGADGTTAETLAEGLGGWMKTLSALDPGDGPRLVAGGLGRLVALGPLAAPDGGERALVEHPGFDLRSLHPSPLRTGIDREVATAEVGSLRVWKAAEGGLEPAIDVGLPFDVERRTAGLRLSGPPVVELPPDGAGRRRFAVGPELRGGARLRVLLVSEGDEGWSTVECWAALPAPEQVEESWIADGDDGPLLVVRTQGALEINAFENQLWRVFRLVPDRTRAGRSPSLAVSVDSKRWHDDEAILADAHRDGRVDLLVARPEGLTGGDLVVERYGGVPNGRFDPRPRRVDLDDAPDEFLWVRDVDGAGRPGLVTRLGRELVVWRVAREGRKPLEREPLLRVPLDAVTGDDRPHLELLGTLPRPGSPPEFLVVARSKQGGSSLIRVRAPLR